MITIVCPINPLRLRRSPCSIIRYHNFQVSEPDSFSYLPPSPSPLYNVFTLPPRSTLRSFCLLRCRPLLLSVSITLGHRKQTSKWLRLHSSCPYFQSLHRLPKEQLSRTLSWPFLFRLSHLQRLRFSNTRTLQGSDTQCKGPVFRCSAIGVGESE